MLQQHRARAILKSRGRNVCRYVEDVGERLRPAAVHPDQGIDSSTAGTPPWSGEKTGAYRVQ